MCSIYKLSLETHYMCVVQQYLHTTLALYLWIKYKLFWCCQSIKLPDYFFFSVFTSFSCFWTSTVCSFWSTSLHAARGSQVGWTTVTRRQYPCPPICSPSWCLTWSTSMPQAQNLSTSEVGSKTERLSLRRLLDLYKNVHFFIAGKYHGLQVNNELLY